MATHSSVLAWRIPGTGKPGGLPSMRSHRVGHDRSDLAAAAATIPFLGPELAFLPLMMFSFIVSACGFLGLTISYQFQCHHLREAFSVLLVKRHPSSPSIRPFLWEKYKRPSLSALSGNYKAFPGTQLKSVYVS